MVAARRDPAKYFMLPVKNIAAKNKYNVICVGTDLGLRGIIDCSDKSDLLIGQVAPVVPKIGLNDL
jgi:hypothetical protein